MVGITPERARFVSEAEKIIGYPYRWSGEGYDVGFDCSGAVRHCWRAAGFSMKQDRNANAMALDFWKGCYKHYEDGLPGDLLFFGPSRAGINHVMWIFRKWPNGRFIIAGARGGGPETNSYDAAYRSWALVDICAETYWSRQLQLVVDPFAKKDIEIADAEEIAEIEAERQKLFRMQFDDQYMAPVPPMHIKPAAEPTLAERLKTFFSGGPYE